jgi:hypothetical protein
MNVQIDAALKRARGYWLVDGFTEMVAGGLFILLAMLILFSGTAPQTSFPAWFLSTTVEIVIAKFVGILVAIIILLWLKDHFTYPRTGYVKGKRISTSYVLVMIKNALLFLLLPILGLLVASLLFTSTGNILASMPVWFPLGVSVLWTVLLVWAGEWMGLLRFRLLGAMVLLAGMAIGFWQFAIGLPAFPANVQPGLLQPAVLESISRTLSGLSFLILFSGIILIFSGVLTFLHYRRENPTPYTEEA